MAIVALMMEGRWEYRVDEKRRFALPPKIRNFDKTWVFAFDPDRRTVVLFPLQVWQRKLQEAENTEQFRLEWLPFEADLDSQGRLTIPRKLKELGKLDHVIQVISLGDQLMLKPVAKRFFFRNRNN